MSNSGAVNIKFSPFKIEKYSAKKQACIVIISLLIILIFIYLDKELNLELDFNSLEEAIEKKLQW